MFLLLRTVKATTSGANGGGVRALVAPQPEEVEHIESTHDDDRLKAERSGAAVLALYLWVSGVGALSRRRNDKSSGGDDREMSDSMPTSLTGAQFEIQAGDYRADLTELGAGLRSLLHRGRPVVAAYEADELPRGGSGQLLVPWPNRIDHGHYVFEGTAYQLELSEPARGNAIHGLTRWASWVPEILGPDGISFTHRLLGRPGYPFCLELAVTYLLDESAGLRVTLTARNLGAHAAPYGTGAHPYLTTGEPLIDDLELELPASFFLPHDNRGIPCGPPESVIGSQLDFRTPRMIGDTSFDHTFTGLTTDDRGNTSVRLASHDMCVRLWAGQGYDWLQLYSGEGLPPELRRRALAIEPMTCPPNSFATGIGQLTIAPGDNVTHSWGIEVST